MPLTSCALPLGNWFCAVCFTGVCALEPAAEGPQTPPPPSLSSPWTVTVSRERSAALPGAALTVELQSVNDTRCAAEVQCVWAGVAEVTLRVTKSGTAPATLVIGTLPSSPANAPTQRTYASYEFSLLLLEPPNSMAKPVEPSQYRATLKVSKLQ